MNHNSVVKKEQLQLTTSIIQQKYCNNGSPSLRVKLLLDYKNVGTCILILYKGSSLVSRYLVSRNTKAAAARDYVQDVRLELRPLEKDHNFDELTPRDDFVVLRPNDHYKAESDVDLPMKDSANPNPDFLGPGNYFLQINVSTWNESADLARKLRDRWRQQGTLWLDSVLSEPMSFTVEEHPKIVSCP
jgi:hypothetical protein